MVTRSACEAWSKGKLVRGLTVHITDYGFTLQFQSAVCDQIPPPEFVAQWGAPKLLRVMNGRERWQHDLPKLTARRIVAKWRRQITREGFTQL